MKALLFFFMFLLTVAGAVAIPIDPTNQTQIDYVESRIYGFNNTYVINWSEDGQEHRAVNGERYGVRAVGGKSPFMIEIDPYMAQVLTIKNNNSLELTLLENPNNPYPGTTVPFRACVNGIEIMNAKRFETNLSYCESDKEYFIGNLKFGQTYTVRFTESIYGTNFSYIWWLGEDDLDGTYGQGGGYPLCEYIFAGGSVNQTQTYVNSTFKMNMSVAAQGSGCPIAIWLEDENRNDVPAWRLISTAYPTVTNVWCKSNSCQKTSPAFGVQYVRLIQCTEPGNRTLRTDVFTNLVTTYPSGTFNMECLTRPIIDDGGAWFVYFIPFAIFGGSYYLILRRKNGEEER